MRLRVAAIDRTVSAGHRENNFDALRLIGALAVILGHAYPLTGNPLPIPAVVGYAVHSFGVVIFFSISGYLVTASWRRSRDVVAYASARCLRIFPALIVVVVASVLILGPLLTGLTVREYFANPRTLSYLDNIWMRPQYDLPGVFTSVPYANVVNGSIWTLPAEFFCYLVVPVLFLVPRRLQLLTLGAALALSLWLASVPQLESPVIYGTRISDAASMWVFFAAGAILRVLHERRAGLFRTDVAVGLLAGYLVFISLYGQWLPEVSWIALPYIVLTVGLASTPGVRRSARFGDLSYGLYLWAFPVQQVVVEVLGVQRLFVNLVLVVAITAMLAWLSWHFIERPSLDFKVKLASRLRGSKATRVPVPARLPAAPAPEAPSSVD